MEISDSEERQWKSAMVKIGDKNIEDSLMMVKNHIFFRNVKNEKWVWEKVER
jgi:hypothetical protein